MGVFDNRRLRSHVRIWNGDIPVGSGFVVGDRQVMTCAHVVGESIGSEARWALRDCAAPSEVIKLDMPLAPGRWLSARVLPNRWRPERSTPVGVELDDAAVLELEEGQALPAGAACVRRTLRIVDDDLIRGLGVGQDQPGGVVIWGNVRELVTPNRLVITSQDIEEAIRPGCSGAAAWSTAFPGLAGMVVEMQEDRTGRIIPVDVLEDIWDFDPPEGPASSRVPRAGPSRSGARAQLGLKDELRYFDREPQIGGFKGILLNEGGGGKKPVICTIGGFDIDRPEFCRDKCRRAVLHQAFVRLGIQPERIEMVPIKWPSVGNFDPEQALALLLNAVSVALNARNNSPQAMRSAYNATQSPMIFYSDLEEEALAVAPSAHRRLFKAWTDYWAEVGAKPLKKPFVHFLLLAFEARSERLGASGPAADDYPDFYQQLLESVGVDRARSLPVLRQFTLREVQDWLDNISDDLRLSRSQLLELRSQAAGLFKVKPAPRLADLESWVDDLSL